MNTLPTDSAERKDYPMFDGCLAYFPAALAGVARHSKVNNDRHNPGEPMHHARGKSTDHGNCIIRHLTDLADLRARFDRLDAGEDYSSGALATAQQTAKSILDEVNALAWRALALSQELHEEYGMAPLAPAARLPEPEPAEPAPVKAVGGLRGGGKSVAPKPSTVPCWGGLSELPGRPLWHVHEPTDDGVAPPVDGQVEVLLRGGSRREGPAQSFRWYADENYSAFDIVAYRVLP